MVAGISISAPRIVETKKQKIQKEKTTIVCVCVCLVDAVQCSLSGTHVSNFVGVRSLVSGACRALCVVSGDAIDVGSGEGVSLLCANYRECGVRVEFVCCIQPRMWEPHCHRLRGYQISAH